ncbi:MAG: restriction endonuclease subunit S [Ignavibacteriaceae bacterium]
MTKKTTRNWIKFLPFRDVILWDVKRYASEQIKSDYPIVKLGMHIKEESHKVKLFDFPEEEFGILGVNNKIGIFDAYKKTGANINQAYKKMEVGWLAYNPYRVNVGSIGMRAKEHQNEYISPAYVVFSCKETLLPDFLCKLFKTERFNKIINESTTGSVRQNLTIEILKTLNIPLPNLREQNRLLKVFYEKIKEAKKYENQIIKIENQIETFILKELGLVLPPKRDIIKGWQFFSFKNLFRWDALSNDARIHEFLSKSKYPLKSLGAVYKFVSRSWEKSKHRSDTFNYIEIGAIDPVLGILENSPIEVSNAPSRATQTVAENDLIIGTTRPYLKKFAVVSSDFNGDVCSSGFSVIEKSDDYNLILLKEFLISYYGIEQMKNRMTGGSYPAITSTELKEIRIPLPPIEIQNHLGTQLTKHRSEMINLINKSEDIRKQALKEFEQSIFRN